MEPVVWTGAGESSLRPRASNEAGMCPLCGGPVGERGRVFVCLRCGFATCPGCEGPSTAAVEEHG